MEQHVRDLGSAELWHTSLERSRKRRELAHDGRRVMTRKRPISAPRRRAMLDPAATSPTGNSMPPWTVPK